MKAAKHTFFTWLAVALTMLVTMMPHHHHGEELCTAIEACAADGDINDRHTGHSSGHDCDETDCTIQTLGTPDAATRNAAHVVSTVPAAALCAETTVAPGAAESISTVKHFQKRSETLCRTVAPPDGRGPPAFC